MDWKEELLTDLMASRISALVHWLPRLLAGKSKQGGGGFRPVILAVLIVGLTGYFNASRRCYAWKTYRLGKGPDAFVVLPWPKAPALSQTLEAIAVKIGSDETFVVVPEGVMLNYLSRRRNPTKYISFMPVELALFGEDAMLAALRKKPPDYVIVVPRNTRELGYRGFGQDYCLKLSNWIDDNYGQIKLLGQAITMHRGKKIVYSVFGFKQIDKSTPSVP